MSSNASQRSPRGEQKWAVSLSSLPTALRLITGLVVMIFIGAGLFLLPGVSTRPLTFSEALFTAASALTVTGLSVIIPASDLTILGQALLLAMIQIGGIGLMISTVVIFRLLGRRISLADRLALRNMFGSLMPGAVLRLTTKVLLGVAVIEGLGALTLFFHWRNVMPPAKAAWFAVFHSISAFCNSGFDLFAGLPGYATIPHDTGTLAIFGTLIFLGSLGVPVIVDLLAYPTERRLTVNTRLTLIMIAILMGIGTLVIFYAEGIKTGVIYGESPQRQLGFALFQTVSARTAGFVGVPTFEQLSPPSQLILIVIMFIGAAPASMGGGITTGTAVVLGLALWSYARNRPYPEVSGRMITTETVRRATAVLVISIMVVLVATLLLLLSDRSLTLDGALFEVVSAFATCGLTLAYTPKLEVFGQIIIILVMIWGRLGALTVMVALARPTKQALYYYPEEQVLIG